MNSFTKHTLIMNTSLLNISLTMALVATVPAVAQPDATYMEPSPVFSSQDDPTTFLGIPIEGTRRNMEQRLLEAGFVLMDDNSFAGVYNDEPVVIIIHTYNRKVCRLEVRESGEGMDENTAKARFNSLVRMYLEDKDYISLPGNHNIPDNESVMEGLRFKNKLYQAVFAQRPLAASFSQNEAKAAALVKRLRKFLLQQSKKEDITRMLADCESFQRGFMNKAVWLTIVETERFSGRYHVITYYENVDNMLAKDKNR